MSQEYEAFAAYIALHNSSDAAWRELKEVETRYRNLEEIRKTAEREFAVFLDSMGEGPFIFGEFVVQQNNARSYGPEYRVVTISKAAVYQKGE